MSVEWKAAALAGAPDPDHVDIWRLSVAGPPDAAAECESLLSIGELERADRFAVQSKRTEFIVTRATLKRILARAAGLDPQSLAFEYGARGKPVLKSGICAQDLRFNVSHSHGLALIAVTVGRDIGVDVERINPDIAWQSMSRRYFSAAEGAALGRVPAARRAEAFFACWTRKEALVKAIGDGIAFGLDEFDVSVDPDGPARLLALRKGGTGPHAWTLAALNPDPAYMAALAMAGSGAGIRCWCGNA